jgi:hypothetical protein
MKPEETKVGFQKRVHALIVKVDPTIKFESINWIVEGYFNG